MQVSTRYAPQLAIAMLLATVPVVLHTYAEVESDECAAPARLVRRSVVRPPSEDRIAFIEGKFGTTEFREGRTKAEDGLPAMSWIVLRTHHSRNVYYRMAHRLLREEPDSVRVESVEVGELTLPIRRVEYKPEPASPLGVQASYLLVYDGEPVGNPYLNQFLAAPQRVFTGSLPMTALFISGESARGRADDVRERQTRWILEAWTEYRTLCFPEEAAP